MPAIKGGKTSVQKLKQRTASKSGEFGSIWNVKEDDELTVRFLTEPDEWFGYEEYWDEEARMYVPVVEGDTPNSEARLKYLASAVILDTDRVVALKLPKSLANTLLSRYDKFGTIMDREYELVRSGKGLDTKYEAINEGPSKFNFKKYKPLDLLDVLESEWERANGPEDDDDKPAKKKAKPGKPEKKAKKEKAAKGRKRGSYVEEEDEDEEPEEEEAEAGDEVWTEDDLTDMNIVALRNIAKGFGVKTSGMRKADIIEAILEDQPF